MAVSAFEVLVSGLASRYFISFPGALDVKKREFSLEDVEGFKTEADATDLLISRRVSTLMYGGLESWSKWFAEKGDMSLSDLAIDWKVVREVFQRRHIVTHSGGLVSAEYLAKVDLPNPPALGSRLIVDEEYLQKTFDELDALGTGLGARAWSTWLPEKNRSANVVLQRTYQTMNLGRWRVAESLAAQRVQGEEEVRHAIRCNGWLSRAERQGYDAIADEVQQWDVSALSGRFKLVRKVLLQDLDAALVLLPGLLTAGEVRRGEIREWPILRTLREHPAYEAVASAHGI